MPKAGSTKTDFSILDEYVLYTNGGLVWKKARSNRFKAGDKIQPGFAGRYLSFNCMNKRFYVHRAVYYLYYGKIPKIIDHIDGNPVNNLASNLQDVTQTVNLHRRRLLKLNKTSKYRGVFWNKAHEKWQARIAVKGHAYMAGYYKSEKLAAMSFDLLAVDKHGNNAMTNFPMETYL